MNSVSRAIPSTESKIFLVILLAFSTLRLIDFLFFGYELRSLIAALGLALMGFGTFKNGVGKEAPHRAGRYASGIGIAMVLASVAMRLI